MDVFQEFDSHLPHKETSSQGLVSFFVYKCQAVWEILKSEPQADTAERKASLKV